MPPTSIFINAASSGISGIGNSRSSVLLGPRRTAASTFSTTWLPFAIADDLTPPCTIVCLGWHAWLYHEKPRPRGRRCTPARMDPSTLCANRRRDRDGVGARVQRPRLPADRDACGVLDGSGAASFQDFQAAGASERRRPAAGIHEKCASRARRL